MKLEVQPQTGNYYDADRPSSTPWTVLFRFVSDDWPDSTETFTEEIDVLADTELIASEVGHAAFIQDYDSAYLEYWKVVPFRGITIISGSV